MAHDLLIVGGGINGCAIAREAALLGLSVLLVERDDLAQHTSSASSKLIHGGLRYLEYREFGLVREALQERERLIRAAPHLIHPMAFVLPHEHAVRPWWLVRAGLYLYDALALGTTLPRSRRLRARDDAYRAPLTGAAKGFVYYDAFVDDARLTLANAIDAADAGAQIATRTALLAARRKDDHWRATLSDGRIVTARAIVNAAGPWVGDLFAKVGVTTAAHVRLVKGSHIVVPKLYDGDHAYILQQADGRIVFAIPWLRDFTAIGTTDIPVNRPEDARIDAKEIRYLCDAANHYFERQIAPADVVDSWSGVRPLFDDGASDAKAVTRDYVLELDDSGPALLSVFGGKITTARHLAEDALAKLASVLGIDARHVTRDRPFPGGDTGDFDAFLASVRARFPFLGDQRSARMAHAYGTRLWEMLDGVRAIADLGPEFGAGLTAVELGWMRTREWARTAADVLERRSKLRLTADAQTRDAVEAYFRETL
ncbi:glycerol-3-phosphate dehydrogenase [uncultured Sphingomonas sp.]|uniref:glycerol-3-phosphate dehydrogenase n=1 Tax=uncultured Sphingomonas sp. TaxID=158754 RepID=UPI0025E1E853|nr:glycerol-3-phosphate dehydrogenase [uncultured Sphingomonas sp.]